MGMVFGFLIAFFGMLYLIGVRATGSVKNAEYEHKQIAQRNARQERMDELNRIRDEWLARVVDPALEQKITYAVYKEEPWCQEELDELCGNPEYADDPKYIYIRFGKAVTDRGVWDVFHTKDEKKVKRHKEEYQKRGIEILLANRGKMSRKNAMEGFDAIGDMKSADGLDVRERNLAYVMFLDSLLKKHGVQEPLKFMYLNNGATCSPGSEMDKLGQYVYHPEIHAVNLFPKLH